jgi:hypothetical protein
MHALHMHIVWQRMPALIEPGYLILLLTLEGRVCTEAEGERWEDGRMGGWLGPTY